MKMNMRNQTSSVLSVSWATNSVLVVRSTKRKIPEG
ncbi:hypothetical protein CJF30_00006961 [Rutstroemia sp. NJR-2017a BBW]|nr:hypothetical protein CJF30_00006961 [Rutstroemia sp. NJR-2017a BBW]